MNDSSISPKPAASLFGIIAKRVSSTAGALATVGGVLGLIGIKDAFEGTNILVNHGQFLIVSSLLFLVILFVCNRVADGFMLFKWYNEEHETHFPRLAALKQLIVIGRFSLLDRKRLFQSARIFIELKIWTPKPAPNLQQFIDSYRAAESRVGPGGIGSEDQVNVENCFAFTTDEKRSIMRRYFAILARFQVLVILRQIVF